MADDDQDNGQNDGIRKFSMNFAPKEPIPDPQPPTESESAGGDTQAASPESDGGEDET